MPFSVPSQRTDAGFTLIELLVVILIIGILAAIGIPALLSQRDKAKNAGAKSAVRTALTAAKTYYLDTDSFENITPAALKQIEPTLYPTDCNATTAGHQPCAPTNDPLASTPLATSFTPGDDAQPKDVWIGYSATSAGTTFITRGVDAEEIVLCSVSTGNAIACVWDNETTGAVTYKEYREDKGGVPVVNSSNSRLQLAGANINPATAWGNAF